ncbi:MAG: 16S rRNA (cytosine(1402)-N(4))-methyltransferase RsmH [Verrucomicrobiae bacterium]|nr:16S rRNA (cytosine(1402)-N(4))-methyltransferase RsmH [Verrucomicrobiae bacterium]
MTEFSHQPVMLAEVLQALRPQPGQDFADGTLGAGGHAAAVLAATAPNGRLWACDHDAAALAAAAERLAEFAGRFELRRGNFAELNAWVPAESCAGVLLDLGVSSPQLDTADRGFSFQKDGPLDMRMDQRQAETAAMWVNTRSAEELARIFWEYGDESRSRALARAVVRQRETGPFTTTRQLAELIERLAPRGGRKAHPATRVFQALRIAVNDEIGSLERGLDGALKILKPGGRLAVITFHSLEDRVVKQWARRQARDYTFETVDVPALRRPRVPVVKLITRKAVQPGAVEQRENPRSRSAQLRVVEKI